MEKVRMTHPDLPGVEITVTARAATVHALSGWQYDADEAEPDATPATDDETERPGDGEED